jgi:hypothetical protein
MSRFNVSRSMWDTMVGVSLSVMETAQVWLKVDELSVTKAAQVELEVDECKPLVTVQLLQPRDGVPARLHVQPGGGRPSPRLDGTPRAVPRLGGAV